METMTFVQGETRISFDPERLIFDYETNKDQPLYDLYVRDVDLHNNKQCYIEGPDGEYAYAPKVWEGV